MIGARMRKIAASALVVLTGIVAGWHAVRLNAAEAMFEKQEIVAAKAVQSLLDPKSASDSPPLLPDARMLAEYPASAVPLLGAGIDRARARGMASARPLVLEAVRRDPRSTTARLWLVLDALKRGHRQQAMAQLDRLMSYNHVNAPRYFPVMELLAADPAAYPQLQSIFAAKPLWGSDFVGYLIGRKADPALILALANGPASDRQHAALIQGLVDKQDYERAYLTWINVLPTEDLARIDAIYDGGFEGRPGPLPFNWKLTQNEVATVTIERGSGLVINYAGDTATPMAEQMMLLEAQPYRLSYSATGDDASDGGKLVSLRILCLPDRKPVFEAPIQIGGTRQAEVNIPPGCPAQIIAIEGAPGDISSPRQLTVKKISIAPR